MSPDLSAMNYVSLNTSSVQQMSEDFVWIFVFLFNIEINFGVLLYSLA